MFVYIRSAAFVIVVKQKLVLQQSKKRHSKVYRNPIQYLLAYYKEVKSTIVSNNTFFSIIIFLLAGSCIPAYANGPRIFLKKFLS